MKSLDPIKCIILIKIQVILQRQCAFIPVENVLWIDIRRGTWKYWCQKWHFHTLETGLKIQDYAPSAYWPNAIFNVTINRIQRKELWRINNNIRTWTEWRLRDINVVIYCTIGVPKHHSHSLSRMEIVRSIIYVEIVEISRDIANIISTTNLDTRRERIPYRIKLLSGIDLQILDS